GSPRLLRNTECLRHHLCVALGKFQNATTWPLSFTQHCACPDFRKALRKLHKLLATPQITTKIAKYEMGRKAGCGAQTASLNRPIRISRYRHYDSPSLLEARQTLSEQLRRCALPPQRLQPAAFAGTVGRLAHGRT